MRQRWESPKLKKTLGPRKQVSWCYPGRPQKRFISSGLSLQQFSRALVPCQGEVGSRRCEPGLNHYH